MSQKLNVIGDVSLNNHLYVNNDATINDKLRVNGNITAKADAIFEKNVTIQGYLTAGFAANSIPANAIIGGVATTNGLPAETLLNDVTMTKRLFVNDKITAVNGAHINDDLSVGNKLNVTGTSTINALFVAENAIFDKNVTVTGVLNTNFPENSIPSSKIIGGALPANSLSTNVTIGNNLTVINNATINKDLVVTDDATIGDQLIVNGTSRLNNTLDVAENATFAKDITVIGVLNASFPESSIPSSKIIGGVLPANSLATDVTIGNNLTVTNNATINKDLFVTDDATIGDQLIVTGRSTLNGDLNVNGKSQFIGDISINNVDFMKNAKFLENVEITKDLVVKGKLEVENYTNTSIINTTTTNYTTIETEDINVTGGITVSETATVKKLDVNETATINAELTVKKDVTLEQNLTVANNLTVNGIFTATPADNSISSSKIIGGLLPADTFSNDISLDKRLFVGLDVSMNNNLYIKNNLTVGGTLNVIHANNSIPLSAVQNINSIAPDYNTDINMTKNLTVGGIIHANAINVAGDIEMGAVGGRVKFRNDIEVFDDISMGGTLLVGGDIGVRSRFLGDLDVCGNFYANYAYKSIPSSAINGQVEATPNFSGDVNMSGNLAVAGHLTTNLGLNVTSGTTIVNTLTASGSINGTNGLNIQGSVSFPNNSISLASIADINTITPDYSQNIVMDSNLTVGNKLYVNNGLRVQGGTVTFPTGSISASAITGLGDVTPNFSGAVVMSDDLTVSKRLFVTQDVSLNGRLYVNNTATFNNGLTVQSGIVSFPDSSISASAITGLDNITPSFNGAVVMNDNLTVSKRLFVTQDVSLNGKLYVNNTAKFNNRVDICGNLYAQYPINSIPLSAVSGTEAIQPDYTQAIVMTDDLTVSKRLFVNQDVSMNKNLYVSGNVTVNNTITRDLTVSNDMVVYDKFIALNGLTVEAGIVTFPTGSISADAITGLGDVTPNFSGAVVMNDDLTVSKRLFVTQKSTLSHTDVTGNLVVDGLLRANNGLTVIGTINIPDNSIPLSAVSGTDAIQPDYTQNIVMSQDLTANRLFVTTNTALANTTVNGSLTVTNGNTIINNVKIGTDTISSLGAQNLNLSTTSPTAIVSVNRNLAVSGATISILNGDSTISNGNSNITNGNIVVTNGNITTNQAMQMRDITVTGNTTFPTGSISANAITGLGDVTPNFSGAVVMSDDLTVSKRLFVTQKSTLSHTDVTGNLVVDGLLRANNGLTVIGTINIPDNSIPLSAVSGTDAIQPDYTQNIVMSQDLTANRLFVTTNTALANTTVNGSLTVTNGNTIINNVKIGTDTISSLGAQNLNLSTTSPTAIVSVNRNLAVSGATISILNGDSTISNGNSNITNGNIVVTNGNITTNQDIQMRDITVTGNTTFPTKSIPAAAIDGQVEATPNFNGAVIMNDTLNVTNLLTASNGLSVTGDFTVSGTTTTLNTTNLDISDSILQLSSGLTSSTPPVNDSGFLINRGNQQNAFMGWDETNDQFIVGLTDDSTGSLNINKHKLATGDININGDITVTGNIIFPAASIPLSAVSGTEAIQPDYTQAIVMTDDLTVSKRLFVTQGINGINVGTGNSSSTDNTAVGFESGKSITTGINNTSVGTATLSATTTGTDNTAFGYGAGSACTGNENTFMGSYAGVYNVAGTKNTSLGYLSLLCNVAGTDNVAIGHNAIFGAQNNDSTNNTAVGSSSLKALEIGGNNNTAIGFNSGATNITGANNTYLGEGADAASGAFSNSTALGSGSIITKTDQIVLGKSTNPPEIYIPGDISMNGNLAVSGNITMISNCIKQW